MRNTHLGGGYWKKKKNIRKYKILKSKKKTAPQHEFKKDKLTDLNILQANVCGLYKKKTHLAKLMDDKKVHIALLQETLHSSCNTLITGYTAYPCKCQGCRGIVTYIRNDIQGEVEHLNWHPTDAQKITLWHGNNKVTIYNLYCPPSSTLSFLDQRTCYKKTVIAGDLNGHSPFGATQTRTTRERRLKNYVTHPISFYCRMRTHQKLSSIEGMELCTDPISHWFLQT